MAAENFTAVMAEEKKHEGGYVDHPKDPGGATNMGITLLTLQSFRKRPVSKADVKALTWDEAQRIYRQNYWDPLRGDDLPAGVDLAVMDYGVNSGISRSAKTLQAEVDIPAKYIDGKIGPMTLKALSYKEPKAVVQGVCYRRMGFLRGLKTWGTFGKGWSRRVADVEAKGVAMAIMFAGADAGQASRDLVAEHFSIMSTKGTDRAKAVGSGTGGTAGLAATSDMIPQWVIYIALGLLALVVLNYVGRYRHNVERSDAYKRAAEELGHAKG